MMTLRVARLCRQLGVSRSVAETLAAHIYGEGKQ